MSNADRLLNSEGVGVKERACNVRTSSGSTYLFTELNELWSLPDEPTSCSFRDLSYDDGLIRPDYSDCNEQSALFDPDVVESMGVNMVHGDRRCVLKMKNGLDDASYTKYAAKVRDLATTRSRPYIELLDRYQKLEEAYELAKREKDRLKSLIKSEEDQYNGDMANYNRLTAETAALGHQIATMEADNKKLEASSTSLANSIYANNDDIQCSE